MMKDLTTAILNENDPSSSREDNIVIEDLLHGDIKEKLVTYCDENDLSTREVVENAVSAYLRYSGKPRIFCEI
jgi:hypothetical protein